MATHINMALFLVLLLSGMDAEISEPKERETRQAEEVVLKVLGEEAFKALVKVAVNPIFAGEDKIAVTIIIDNYSEWLFDSANYYVQNGRVRDPPVRVKPGAQTTMLAHKTAPSFHGSSGAISWLVEKAHKERIIVMWSVAYGSKLNRLAVGITPDGGTEECWFRKMHAKETGPFQYADYGASSSSIRWCGKELCIEGTMGNTNKPKVALSVFPRLKKDIADNVREASPNMPRVEESKVEGNYTLCEGGTSCLTVSSVVLAGAIILAYFMV